MYSPGFFNIGSFGAMIRLRQTPRTAQQFFDVGIAGPLAGFVVAVGLLVYGFLNLPGDIYLLQINPEYIDVFGGIPTETELKQWLQSQGGTAIYVGNSLLFEGLKQLLADPARVPNHFELLHYPYLFVGYITLFFTALNLLPVGQLDGGHILYGLLGRKRAGWVSRGVILALVTLGGIGLVGFSSEWSLLGMGLYAFYLYLVMSRVVSKDSPHRWLYILLLACGVLVLQALLAQVFPTFSGSTVWLIFGFLSARFFGPDHPSAAIEAPLSTGRKFLGWLALLIFILCFSPEPLGVYLPEPPMPMVLR
jgi:membrane-associated protease RseP (regulator of RpoE activity)